MGAGQTTGEVKHAGPDALDRLDGLLSALREVPGLREKSRGTFYRGSRAFLHFHEDPAGLFADVRFEATFERVGVSNAKDQGRLLRKVRSLVSRTVERHSALLETRATVAAWGSPWRPRSSAPTWTAQAISGLHSASLSSGGKRAT